MEKSAYSDMYKSLVKVVTLAAGLFILFWFLYTILSVVLLLILAIVLALIINAPVTWLEKRKIPRLWGALIVFVLIILGIGFLGWLIIPKIIEQLELLIKNLPLYINALTAKFSTLSNAFQDNTAATSTGSTTSDWMPSLPNTLLRLGNYSLSVIGTLLIIVVFISMVIFMVINPRPLLELYLSVFRPENREKAAKALAKSSVMLIGWMRANLIGGGIEAVCVVSFLNIIHLPGAWVWGALTFFSELVPKIGFYIMVVPPLLVALSINPLTALWLAIFFIILAIIVGDFLMPRLRSSTMDLHPVSTMFVLLAMSATFGFTGVLIATPLTAFIKAYYEEFYLSRFTTTKETTEHQINSILYPKKKK
jgi:predicted PurR-regulated permease PerM